MKNVKLLSFVSCILIGALSHSAYANGFGWPSGMHVAISITYDDGYIDNLDNAMPTLEAHGYKGTFYLTKSIVQQEDASTSRNLISEWQQAFLRGHEIGSHGVNHTCSEVTGDYNNSQMVATEALGSKIWLDSTIGVDPIRSYAYPCGETLSYDPTGQLSETYYPDYVANHYFVARTGNGAINNIADLKVKRVVINGHALTDSTSTIAYIDEVLSDAKINNDWVIFIFHSVGGNKAYNISKAAHDAIISHIYSKGIYWVAPVRDVANYITWFH